MAGRETGLETALIGLRDTLTGVRLPHRPAGDGGAAVGRRRTWCVSWMTTCCPGSRRIDAPLLAVVGGSTGAGKSTLVNSLVGRRVTAPGVIRPTTRSPVLVHHSSDASWFTTLGCCPAWPGRRGPATTPGPCSWSPTTASRPGLAILDAPDIDSVVAENRKLAAQLLAAADLWLFVTSAARYADAVPWEFLLAAADRSAAVAVVLDRVPPRAMAEVPAHLGQTDGRARAGAFAAVRRARDRRRRRGSAAGPGDPADPELAGPTGRRPGQPVRGGPPDPRRGHRMRSPGGPLRSRRRWTSSRPPSTSCGPRSTHSYAEAVRTVGVQTADGTLLRGEVLARWQEFVGTGEFFRAMEQKISWLRDRITAAIKGEPSGVGDLKVAVESGLEALLRSEADAAAERADASWQANAAGRQLLGRSGQDLTRAAPDFADRSARAIRDWQGAVLDLVADEGMSQAVPRPVHGPGRERGRGRVDDRRLRPDRRHRSVPRSASPAAPP